VRADPLRHRAHLHRQRQHWLPVQSLQGVIVEQRGRAIDDEETVVFQRGLRMPGRGRHKSALPEVQPRATSFQFKRQLALHRHHPLREIVPVHARGTAVTTQVEGSGRHEASARR